VNQFILRRTNTLLSDHLPPKVVEIVCCGMSPMQVEIYTHLLASKVSDMQVEIYTHLLASKVC
jgi:DNA repair and recombination RAD54-like protein